MRSQLLSIVALALAAAACRGEKGTEAEIKNKKPPTSPSAASQGTFCKKHGVLEAVCTKCNPALAAVFQAKGDWCEEHGFPESFCPICKPELGGRPPTDVSDDGAPSDGTKVRFKTKETVRLAGIQVAKATARTSRSHIGVTARIIYDTTRSPRSMHVHPASFEPCVSTSEPRSARDRPWLPSRARRWEPISPVCKPPDLTCRWRRRITPG